MSNIKYTGISKQHPLFAVFHLMHQRCRDKNRDNYKYYGGRGIAVCPRWSSPDGFLNFLTDLGPRPTGYQLDRKDVNGDYTPDNCHWVNKYQQMANTRTAGDCPGVNWSKRLNKWRARIKVNGREIALGVYTDYQEAMNARLKAEEMYV